MDNLIEMSIRSGDLVLANDKWFDYQHHSMLLDLGDEPLVAESD